MLRTLVAAVGSAALVATAAIVPLPFADGARASAPSAACEDGKNWRVRMVNATGTTIQNLYGSNVTRESWEEDVLGEDVLRAGGSVVVNWDDGSCQCLFDFKAVFSDGDVATRRGVNVCTLSTFRFTE